MLKSPYVYFGGKSKIMPLIWQYLGDVDNFVDPFVGSLASILCRPDWHQRKAETVNDKDNFIANFWRSLQTDPEAVAHYADWPVNECDLTARHIWLVNHRDQLARLEGDPDYYDAKIAGWWVWGINAWIGSGWCSGSGSWNVDANGCLIQVEDGAGVSNKLPHLGDRGRGINRQLPHLASNARGIQHQTNTESLIAYMRQLADRLRGVRVCCGDWARVVTPGALAYGETVGVFLDPPYDLNVGRDAVYNHESDVSTAVRDWVLANGDDPRYRIVLCGYDGEHAMPDSWREIGWTAGAAYQNHNGNGRNNTNRKREHIWISPHCIGQMQMTLKGANHETHGL